MQARTQTGGILPIWFRNMGIEITLWIRAMGSFLRVEPEEVTAASLKVASAIN